MTNEWKPLGYDIFKEGELKIKRIHKIDNVSVDDMEVILVALKDLITSDTEALGRMVGSVYSRSREIRIARAEDVASCITATMQPIEAAIREKSKYEDM